MIDARQRLQEGDAKDLRLHTGTAEEPLGDRLALSGAKLIASSLSWPNTLSA